MTRFKLPATFTVLALSAIMAVAPAVHAQDQSIETAALRCSAISVVHSTLTIPTPQFGELMTQFAGLFAQIHILHKGNRTKAKINPNDVRIQRDDIVSELSKGWPGVKNERIREAAICNAWRINIFSKLTEKPTEKEFQAALLNVEAPPAKVTQPDIDKWAKLTPEAFSIWAQIKVHQKDKK